MRIIKRILVGLLGIIALLAVVGMLLPREVWVERNIKIDAQASDIFPHINNLRATVPWSPWLHQDPKTDLTFNDIPEGKGAVMTWESDHPNVGAGRMEIMTSLPEEGLEVALDFGDMGTADAYWTLSPDGAGTRVVWGFTTDMGAGPVGRWMGLMMDRWVGGDYQRGLENLKALVEAN